MKIFKWIFIVSVISLLIVGFSEILLVDKFLNGKDYFWKLKDVLWEGKIVLSGILLVGAGLWVFSTLRNFKKKNGLK